MLAAFISFWAGIPVFGAVTVYGGPLHDLTACPQDIGIRATACASHIHHFLGRQVQQERGKTARGQHGRLADIGHGCRRERFAVRTKGRIEKRDGDLGARVLAELEPDPAAQEQEQGKDAPQGAFDGGERFF